MLLANSGLCPGAEPIPADKQVPMRTVHYLAAPEATPLHLPTDVAVGREGRTFVADGANDRIVYFTAAGDYAGAVAQLGNVTFDQPLGIATDNLGNLWIADAGHRRLVCLDPNLQLRELIDLPSEPNQPADATDVAVSNGAARCYVVDNDNQRIMVYDRGKGTWQNLGERGKALGQFQWPFMICLGLENYLYVSEAIGARVQRINPDERWSGQLGSWGVELGHFYRPKGLAADRRGRLFVSDSTFGVIQIFGPWGELIGAVTGENGQIMQFQHPMGLAFDAADLLYVVEMTAGRVAVLQPGVKQ